MPYSPIHAGAVISADHATHILTGLKARTLPKPEWTHGAHLTAGVMLLDEVGLDGALDAMPGIIRRYNEATGVPNTDSEGYHHTITVFYLAIIDGFCAERLDAPPHDRATSLLASQLARKDYPFEFYSKERLFSVQARRELVAPDLKDFNIMIAR